MIDGPLGLVFLIVFFAVCGITWLWTVIGAEAKRREVAAYRSVAEVEHERLNRAW